MENKKKLFDRLLDAIERGRAGENEGIPIPFSRLSDYIPNIQKKTFYLIGGATKSGKTSFADDVFLYGAYDYYKALKDADLLEGFDLDMDYFSFEIDTETKIAKGISRKLWHDYGIIADAKQILSKGKFYCSDELFGLVRNLRDYFNDFEDVVTIFDRVENPTGIHKYLVSKAEKHGESVYKNINIDPDGDPIYRFSHYKPHNNKRYHLYFVDHLGLTMEERGFSTKQTMDKVSSYSVALRNNYSMTPVIIQQMSFDTTNDDRHKSNRLTPTTRDFGDSRYPSRDLSYIYSHVTP